ncbi:MAG TPA: ABC transporter ATP-binding protein [Candidatus Limnocylindria bacterium]|nr:ABC transporter ATP-binding protein [Candidatus Limnocylindria bacterium]
MPGMVAIRAEHLGKRYRLRTGRAPTLKELILRQIAPAEAVHALTDVSFTVERGRCFGVVGANGSGKSTLLRLIAGTAKPTTGTIAVAGRISALLELGAGFHPDFTGRENAHLNGSLLGLTRRETEAAMPAIEHFAQLGRFFDAPIKTYSSGMAARLGFAVAVHVDPDVLLVDEVLAVGDEYFQHKCYAKIAEFRGAGKTIVLVSHDIGLIQRLCDRAIWLDQGRVAAGGTVRDVATAYHLEVGERELRERALRGEVGGRTGSGEIEIVSAKVIGRDGASQTLLEIGDPASFEIRYRNRSGVGDAVFGVYVYRDDGTGIYGTNTMLDDATVPLRDEGVVRFAMDSLALLPGAYDVDVAATDRSDRHYDYHQKALNFRVVGSSREVGIARLPHRWEFE